MSSDQPAKRTRNRSAWREDQRELIRQRTRAALAVKKAEGVTLGRPRGSTALPPDVLDRIGKARAEGATLQAIADGLNADGVPTARGGRWQTSSVQSALRTLAINAAPTRRRGQS